MNFTVKLNIPDADAERFFQALQPKFPLQENEQYDAYINRVAVLVLRELTSDYFISEAQKEAIENIEYPDITVVSE